MSLKKKVASTLAVGALVLTGLLMAPAAANATGNPSHLDQGDLSIQCKRQYHADGWAAQLTGSGAYGWKCVYVADYSDQRDINVNDYCQYLVGAWATATNPSDPYSWKCQGY